MGNPALPMGNTGEEHRVLAKKHSVTREPRAHDSGAKGPREALELGSTDRKHRPGGTPPGSSDKEHH